MRYLTNVEKYDGLAEKVAKAAELSGINIQYRDHPMPWDPFDPEMDEYRPSLVINDASLFLAEADDTDCSKFWRIFESL